MKNKLLDERAVEQEAINLLKKLGYVYVHGPELGPEGELKERDRFSEVILEKRVRAAVYRLNPGIPD